MAGLKSALVFLLQSIVVGLAVAFVVVIIRPDLMPGVVVDQRRGPRAHTAPLDGALALARKDRAEEGGQQQTPDEER